MYTLTRNGNFKEMLVVETPSFVVSLLTAELFYKFHSFTFECLAFLCTWFAISYLISGLKLQAQKRKLGTRIQ